MWLGLLGPLSVRHDDADVLVPAAKQRIVLAALLRRANRVVSFDELAEALWDSVPPSTARVTLHNYVKRLRQVLGPVVAARIITRDPGYLISIREQELDLLHFTSLCAAGSAAVHAGLWDQADLVLGQALRLWRGAPLADVPSEVLRREEVPRLEQMRLQAQEWHIEAALHLGRHDQLVPTLRALIAQHQLRERFHGQLMLALYQGGRQGDALAAYRDARQMLVDELGVEPGPELRRLHQRILAADPELSAQRWAPASTTPQRSAARANQSPCVPAQSAAAGDEPATRRVLPRQVPAGVLFFVGRAAELETLSGLLGRAAAGETGVISAIGGTAGVGKTALAVHWAHQVAGRFPDGQLYVNLRGFGPSDPVTATAALRGFLDALQVPAAQIPGGFEEQQGLYRSLLASRSVLIVLDNARDGDQVRPLLPGSPGCMVVVTSRSELAGLVATEGARSLSLDVLTDAEAHELLARRIGAPRLAAEPDAARELTGLCARLPLALAITAARASARPGFALAALAAELRDARSRLDALATGEQATDLRVVFSWSYYSLEAPAARMFRLLGLHPGPDITAAAAASLAALTPGEAHGLLRELTRRHLLAEPAPGRYVFHDLLRVYAAEQAHAEEGEPGCRQALHRTLDHYLHTGHDAAHMMQPQRGTLALTPAEPGVTPEHLDDHEQALAWFKAEHQVLLSTTSLAAETSFHTCAWQLPWSMATFLDWQGHWHDWAATQRIALAAVTRETDQAAQATARRAFAAACIRRADYDEASIHLKECLNLYAQLGDRAGESRIHRDLGNLSEYQDRYDDALGHAEQALSLSRTIADQAGHAAALTNVGSYHARLGDHQQALICGQQALDLHRELGSRYGEAHTWEVLGYANHHLGRLTEAASCYRHALSLFRELGDRVYEATTLTFLGDTHHAAGDPRAARDAWQQALAILEDLQHPGAEELSAKLAELIAAARLGRPADPRPGPPAAGHPATTPSGA
jgi:DNA-binding SARP family transcriptional activator/tetratricopeptide (TPR) repeat protein